MKLQTDLVLLAESLDEFLVHRLVAVVGQDAEKGLTLVQSLGGLVKAAGETVVDEGGLQDLLDGGVDVHRAGGHGDRGVVDGGGDFGHGFISFDVGHG
jgi:hypothetical protein